MDIIAECTHRPTEYTPRGKCQQPNLMAMHKPADRMWPVNIGLGWGASETTALLTFGEQRESILCYSMDIQYVCRVKKQTDRWQMNRQTVVFDWNYQGVTFSHFFLGGEGRGVGWGSRTGSYIMTLQTIFCVLLTFLKTVYCHFFHNLSVLITSVANRLIVYRHVLLRDVHSAKFKTVSRGGQVSSLKQWTTFFDRYC